MKVLTRPTLWTLLALGSFLALSPGCRQTEGDACQTNSDCKGGLICCFDPVTGRGTCQETCVLPDAGPADAAEEIDAGEEEDAAIEEDATMEEDAMVEVDAFMEDAFMEDASMEDASMEDAMTIDASAP